MKQTTLNDILNLRNFILQKTDEINHYERVIETIRSNYKNMSKSELEASIAEVRWMENTIKAHRKWCDEAQEVINDFYKPATDPRLVA